MDCADQSRDRPFREDAFDHRRGDRTGISASAQSWGRIDASDRGGMARPACDARHRDRLAVNDPELVLSFGGDLHKVFAARYRIVRNGLVEKGDGPVGKLLHVGWPD